MANWWNIIINNLYSVKINEFTHDSGEVSSLKIQNKKHIIHETLLQFADWIISY